MTERATTLSSVEKNCVNLVLACPKGVRQADVGKPYQPDVWLDEKSVWALTPRAKLLGVYLPLSFSFHVPQEARDQLPTPFPKKGATMVIEKLEDINGKKVAHIKVTLPD